MDICTTLTQDLDPNERLVRRNFATSAKWRWQSLIPIWRPAFAFWVVLSGGGGVEVTGPIVEWRVSHRDSPGKTEVLL